MNLYRRLRNKIRASLAQALLRRSLSYQGVVMPFRPLRLHEGGFSDTHEQLAKLDSHLGGNVNKTRLRTYNVQAFAGLALGVTPKGNFLTAGVSFGTAPILTAIMSREFFSDRRFFLIDPMRGWKNSGDRTPRDAAYNTNPEMVTERWPADVPMEWRFEILSPQAIRGIGELAFVHLNTTDRDAEFETLPSIYQHLVPGGIIILDIYGWLDEDFQRSFDEMLAEIGAYSFELVTRQLVIVKQIYTVPKSAEKP
jgi:hypothetical protein